MNSILFGLNDDHIDSQFAIHHDCVADFQALQAMAQANGIDLQIISGFRSYHRQVKIWNEKVKGMRPILGAAEQSLDITKLSEEEKLFSLLNWSALPGLSRHHWGTDFDVYDAAVDYPKEKIQLIQSEYNDTGPFALLSQWLKSLADPTFFRPYFPKGNLKVGSEPWHLSHTTQSQKIHQKLTLDKLLKHWERHPFLLQEVAIEHIDTILDDYVYGPTLS